MTKSGDNGKRGVLYTAILMLICLFCVVTLCACNNQSKQVEVSQRQYNAYISIGYPQDGTEAYVYVMLSGDEEGSLESPIGWEVAFYAKNTWYNAQDVTISVPAEAICAEIESMMTEDMYFHDDVEYDSLKIIFRYDTIYKSIHSDADAVVRGDGKYVHLFTLDGDEEMQTFHLNLTSQNAASWYTMLIACVIILTVALLGVSLAIKGKIWQNRKKKSE